MLMLFIHLGKDISLAWLILQFFCTDFITPVSPGSPISTLVGFPLQQIVHLMSFLFIMFKLFFIYRSQSVTDRPQAHFSSTLCRVWDLLFIYLLQYKCKIIYIYFFSIFVSILQAQWFPTSYKQHLLHYRRQLWVIIRLVYLWTCNIICRLIVQWLIFKYCTSLLCVIKHSHQMIICNSA